MNENLSIFRLQMIIFIILISWPAYIFAQETNEKKTDAIIINVKEANELIKANYQKSDFLILDVRTSEEYESSHIPNALNIDYKSAEFKKQIAKLDKNKIYLTYCRSGRRSAKSAEIMKELGIANVYMIDGGIIAWNREGLPIEK